LLKGGGPVDEGSSIAEAGAERIAEAPGAVERPAMHHVWSDLTFLHWPYDPGEVQRLLPPGLEVDTFEGRAWIGLIPFRVRIRHVPLPAVPWLSTFPEINVRTYVRGPRGKDGIYFLSLDAARAVAALVARIVYGLRYSWARMHYGRIGSVVTYESERLYPRSGAGARLAVAVGERLAPGELTELDLWLTSRWRYYCVRWGRLLTGVVDHEPWPLRRAEVLECAENLIAACGLLPHQSEPLALFSPRVDVRMSSLEPVGGNVARAAIA
jgi:uncharacterized protein YqjF (DUF2071 family)